jgi:hypothetical protein
MRAIIEAFKAEGALGVPAPKVGGAIIERSWAGDILPFVITIFIFEGIIINVNIIIIFLFLNFYKTALPKSVSVER